MNEKRVYTVATAHLDTVWYWGLKETAEQFLPNTISDNFYLFQTVPGYTFNFEGAYRYHLIEEYYPDLFEQIKDYVHHGQWHVSGSAYESGDVNIPSPEALFRNILFGNNYFAEKFGKRSKDIFLPDCFGFGSALPAVIRHANLLGFTTQKLSWGCAYGRPFDLGIWQGIDGSRVFACTDAKSYCYQFRHVRTDSSVIEKLAAAQAEANLPWTLRLHGTGDQGGAPEKSSAIAVSRGLKTNKGNPIQVLSAASDQIFKDLAALPCEDTAGLPVCENELLMTNHGAAAYTSRAMSKRLNRKCELLADMAERAACTAASAAGAAYPTQPLATAWKRMIAHQFHDDITGTSNMEVYNRSWADYYTSLLELQTELTASAGAVSRQMDTSFVQGVPVIVYNSVAAARSDVVRAHLRMAENSPYVKVFDAAGQEVPSQVLHKRGKNFEILILAKVPSMGWSVYDVRPSGTKCTLSSPLKMNDHMLENEKYRLRFNKNGDIGSLFDKELEKELLHKPIKMALLKDIGALNYPAWELRYEEVMAEPVAFANSPTFRIVMDGPVQSAIEVTRFANGSTFVQTVSLSAGGRFVTVENEVNWQSRRTLLKAQFPFTAASQTATYDLGLGVIQRGTNTPNLYEVPAQKWADLSSDTADFGISVFSDSKYGWDKPDDHTLRLTCLHTPAGAFNKEARQDLQDLGVNRFGFALFSHSGDYTMGTQLQSEFYAYPLTAFQGTSKQKGPLGSSFSYGELNDKGVLLRAVKMAEATEEVIVRVNESIGLSHKEVSLRLGNGIASAREVFASEEPLGQAAVIDGALVFDLNRFEVKTFALTLAPKEIIQKTEQVSLPLPYNADVVTENKNRQSAIMAASGMSLPAELFPQEVLCGGIVFKLGKGVKPYNALIPREQQITLPSGCDKLYFLAASVKGDKELTFLVDGKPRIVSVYDLTEPAFLWQQYGLNQSPKIKEKAVPGLEFTHTHSPMEDNFAQPVLFFRCEIDIKNGSTLTLPYDNTVVILAMTAAQSCVKLATQLTDTMPELKAQPAMELTDKVLEKFDFITIRAGKLQNKVKNSTVKTLPSRFTNFIKK